MGLDDTARLEYSNERGVCDAGPDECLEFVSFNELRKRVVILVNRVAQGGMKIDHRIGARRCPYELYLNSRIMKLRE
jgi:hypothetical protein